MNNSRKINLKAILIGFFVDIGGTTLASFVYALIMGIILAVQGVPPTEIEAKMAQGPAVYLSSLVIGFVFTFLGGYVAGRIAKTAEVLHGGMVGVIGVLLGLALYTPLNFSAYPVGFTMVGFALAIPLALLGGYVAKSKNEEGKAELHL